MSVEQYWKSLSGWPDLRSETHDKDQGTVRRKERTEYYDGDINGT